MVWIGFAGTIKRFERLLELAPLNKVVALGDEHVHVVRGGFCRLSEQLCRDIGLFAQFGQLRLAQQLLGADSFGRLERIHTGKSADDVGVFRDGVPERFEIVERALFFQKNVEHDVAEVE